MRKKVKPIPGFRREEDERQFWHTHDATDYFDFSNENRVEIEFDRGVEAPVKSISLRLPREMLNELKVLANKKDVPYQSLIKVYLADKINEERRKSGRKRVKGYR
ncbi:MAG: BrnA antitoxin family protein [Deltaproteobacteria bacterium]|nr:BrnA antitoxin family protein [Deltaproteobacteria bacterium]